MITVICHFQHGSGEMMINYNRESCTGKKKTIMETQLSSDNLTVVAFQVKPLRKQWSFQFLGEIEFYHLFMSAARLKHSLNLFKKLSSSHNVMRAYLESSLITLHMWIFLTANTTEQTGLRTV